MATQTNLGIATAYGYAKSKGYTGTEEEFAILMASYATVAQQAAASASDAAGSAVDAARSAASAESYVDASLSNARDSEAYAIGKRGGVDVPSSDPAYHNNSKYYSDQIGTEVQEAEAARDAAVVAQGKAEDAQTAAETAQGKAEDAQEAAENVAEHPPYINMTTYTWMTWDQTTSQYVNSNVAAKGIDGEDAYVYIRYSELQPTQDSDMKTTPDAWMGVYAGDSATAPTTYTSYQWYRTKGETGYGVPEITSADNGKILKVIEGEWEAAQPDSGLPSVSSSDNGKFLRVVNGQWAAATVPNANGVSF